MKYVGLRRVFPRLSRALRWYLIQLARTERILAKLSPEERVRVTAAFNRVPRL